ncbi:MAG: SPFH domain-containing protein [Eubacteriales bacterium]|nr:SPFH domain-containing protein [Eubacteriales bacterium]
MGLFDFIKSQFIEVIEWTDSTTDTMVYNFPVQGREIKMGAQLTVRESQAAVFVNEGQIADVFSPGRYTLSTQNMPILTKIKSWKYGFISPFKAEVYFVNTKQFTDQKWGTSNPVMMRDAEFGMLRLRAFGIYSFKVNNPSVFLKEVFGTSSEFTTESITGQLKRAIVSGISDLLGETKTPAIDLAMYYDELSEQSREKLKPMFDKFGFELVSFYIENISLPEEVEKVLDKRTSMGVIGDMGKYAQYQTAEAIREAANNPGGGLASAGAGIGAGAAIGKMMAETLGANTAPKQQEARVICPSCGQETDAGRKFCSACGKPLSGEMVKCVKCGADIQKGKKFCPDCGAEQEPEIKCSNCGAAVNKGVKFCPDCGKQIV